MQFIIETVPSDIALMFVTYLSFCLLLMYLFIRADFEWNKREVAMLHERLRTQSSERNDCDRLHDLTVCSEHHDIQCACFLHGGDADERNKDSRGQ